MALGHNPVNCEDKDTDSLARTGQQGHSTVGNQGGCAWVTLCLSHTSTTLEGVEHESYGPHCGEQVLIYTETNRDCPGGGGWYSGRQGSYYLVWLWVLKTACTFKFLKSKEPEKHLID